MAERAEPRAAIAFEAERRRLQRLARALLREEASAEDAVQDAWLAFLCTRDGAPRDPRAWLAATVRRLAQSSRRESARRARREREAARPEGGLPADEAAARIEVLRRLLDAVEALDEPYRTAIVRRFLDGLPPRAIAREHGVPVATVRTHVRRGLERLREALDARCGDERSRERFLSALAPVAGFDASSIGAVLEQLARGGASLMKWRAMTWGALLCALFAGGIAGGIAGWIALERGGEKASEVASIPAEGAGERELAAPVAPERAPAAPSAGERTALAPSGGLVVRGVVVTPARTVPLPDAALSLRLVASSGELLAEGRVRADARGHFAWPAPPPAMRATLSIRAASDALWLDFERVLHAGEGAPDELLLVALDRAARVVGRLLDASGAPLAGEKLVLLARDDELGLEPAREQRTDERGAFAFEGVGVGAHQLSWERSFGEESAYALSRLVALEPGELEREVDIRPLGRTTLRGRIEGDAELARRAHVMLQPVASAELADEAEHMARFRSTIASSGEFAFEGLQPGRYRVRVFAGPGAMTRTDIDVPEDGELSIVLELERRR